MTRQAVKDFSDDVPRGSCSVADSANLHAFIACKPRLRSYRFCSCTEAWCSAGFRFRV